MNPQVRLRVEMFLADGANFARTFRMTFEMNLTSAASFKHCLTDRTRVRTVLAVGFYMLFHAISQNESLATCGAHMRSFTSVNEHVFSQRYGTPAGLAADIADESVAFAVRVQVRSQ